MDLLQEICKEVSLKHTGIKQEPYSAPVQDTHANHRQQDISQIQTDIKILKESINTPHPQYAVPLDTDPVTLQQQLSKMKEDIKHLQQTKCPNVYSTPTGNYRSFRITDDSDSLVICRQCNHVEHFASACLANLPPPRAPTRYQNYRHNYIPSTSQHQRLSYTPNQHSQRTSYRPNANRHNTKGYPYPQDALYTNPSKRPPIPSNDQTNSKHQV